MAIHAGENQATAFSCAVNLSNTIIGAGMLGLPGAFAGTGFLSGSILILLGALASAMTLRLLSLSAETAGLPATFYTVARASLPSIATWIDVAVILMCFGGAVAYLIAVGDCMIDASRYFLSLYSDIVPQYLFGMLVSRHFWVTAGLVLVLPFSFLKTLDGLQCASTLALVSVMLLAAGVVAFAHGVMDPCEEAQTHYQTDDISSQVGLKTCFGEPTVNQGIQALMKNFPIFIFSFGCVENIFPVVNEIENRTQARMNAVIFSSIGFATIVYYIVAVEGYRTYGGNIRSNIMLNYPETLPVTVMRILIALVLVFSIPLRLDPCRRCLLSLIRRKQRRINVTEKDIEKQGIDIQVPAEASCSYVRSKEAFELEKIQSQYVIDPFCEKEEDHNSFMKVTYAFLLLSYGVAMMVDDLGLVFALVGATASTMIGYIVPGAIYIKLHEKWDGNKLCAWLLLTAGCLIMPAALFVQLDGAL